MGFSVNNSVVANSSTNSIQDIIDFNSKSDKSNVKGFIDNIKDFFANHENELKDIARVLEDLFFKLEQKIKSEANNPSISGKDESAVVSSALYKIANIKASIIEHNVMNELNKLESSNNKTILNEEQRGKVSSLIKGLTLRANPLEASKISNSVSVFIEELDKLGIDDGLKNEILDDMVKDPSLKNLTINEDDYNNAVKDNSQKNAKANNSEQNESSSSKDVAQNANSKDSNNQNPKVAKESGRYLESIKIYKIDLLPNSCFNAAG